MLDILNGILTRRHTLLVRASHAGLVATFSDILGQTNPGLVVLTAPYVESFLEIARAHGAFVVIDADQWWGRLNRQVVRTAGPWRPRIRALIETYTLAPMERTLYPQADEVWVASPVEATHFAHWMSRGGVRVVPNVAPAQREAVTCSSGIRSVAYLGSYGHPPNEAAALELMREIMPAVRRLGGPRELRIIGRGPTSAMRRAADRETVITGEVEDAAAALCEAGLLVVPLRSGGGTRLKILEAAMLGVPVVSTATGLEGLDFVNAESVLVGESAEELAEAVVRLAQDDELRWRLTSAAQAVVRDRYTQRAAEDAIDAAVTQLLAVGGSRPG